MFAVKVGESIEIEEAGHCLIKGNSMLAQVLRGFRGVIRKGKSKL
jgi:hypothetical protein